MKKFILFVGIIIITSFIFVYRHIPYFNFINAIKNINSDNGIFLLMAEKILKEKTIPIFYWGQNYLGPLNPLMIAFIQNILNFFKISIPSHPFEGLSISPVAMVISNSIFLYLGHFFYYLVSLRFVTKINAFFILLILVTGNSIFSETVIQALGQDMGYFLSGLILILGLNAIEKQKYYILCFIAGFSWWMSQTVIFSIAPLLVFFLFSEKKLFEYIVKNLDLKNRLLGMRFNILKLKYLHLILLFPILLGIFTLFPGAINIREPHFHLKINNGLDYIKTPLFIFLITQFFLEVKHYAVFKNQIINFAKNYFKFFGFFILGYSPVIIGKILYWYPKSYKVELKLVPIIEIPQYCYRLITDYYPRILFDGSIILTIFLSILVSKYAYEVIKNNFKQILKLELNKSIIPLLCLSVFVVFTFIVDRVRTEYTLRYALQFIPAVLLVIFQAFEQSKNISYKSALALSLLAVLFCGHTSSTHYLEANLKTIPPTEEIQYLLDQPKTLCYANYWDVYRLHYLTNHKIEFIPKDSQDRTPERTKEVLKNHNIDCIYDSKSKKIVML
jgi:hypothetical protein